MLNRVKKIKQLCCRRLHGLNSKIKLLIKIFCILLAIAFVACVCITIFRIIHPPLNEDFFKSDDSTKTVISLESERAEGDTTSSVRTQLVYTYNGDEVTGLKTYFEYPSEEAAAAAIDSLKTQPEFEGAVLEGKYIIVAAPEDQYKGLTTSDVKQQAEAIKDYQNSKQK